MSSNRKSRPPEYPALLKQKLLERAQSGKSKPSRHAADAEERVLALALSNCDLNLTFEIEAVRPDWFIDEHEINKKKLLDAALQNVRDAEIIVLMGFYLVKTSRHFDIRVHAEIMMIRPEWLKRL